MSKTEYRSAGWEAKEGEKIAGYAVVFEERTVLYRDPETGMEYGEVIDRHALDRADMSDVVLRFDHQGHVLARTRNKSLKLTVDDHGLFIEADMSGSDEARSFYGEVKNGLLDKMSFAFTLADNGDTWEGSTRTRHIHSIEKLFDVALVTFPAYEQTQVSARDRFRSYAEPDVLQYRAAEVMSIQAAMEQLMDSSFPFLRDAKITDFVTRHELQRANAGKVDLPFGFKKHIDECSPVYRELLELRKNWAANVGQHDVQAAQLQLERYNALEAEIRSIAANRAKTRSEIANGSIHGKIIEKLTEQGEKKMEIITTRKFYEDIIEKRAAGTTGTLNTVIPSTVIDEYILEETPGAFLEDAKRTTIRHSGNLTLPVYALQPVAAHAENAAIETADVAPSGLTITHSEYAFNAGFSALGGALSVSSLKSAVGDTVMASMLKTMDKLCLAAAAGLDYIDNTNAVKMTDAPAYADMVMLASMLGSDYLAGAKWYCNPTTYFNWLLGLKDSNQRPILDPSKAVSEHAPLGFKIRLDAQIPANTLYFGAGNRIHLNFADEPRLVFWTDNDTNTEKCGSRAIAGAAAETGSFVKMYL